VKSGSEKGGRPAFIPSKAKRKLVEIMVAVGTKQPEIARALGCDAKTLRKHFADELDNGLARRRAAMLAAQYQAGLKGNATAQQRFLDRVERAQAEKSLLDPPASGVRKAKARKLGKKEQALLDAQTAGTGSEWGDDLNPLAGTRNLQ